MEISMTPTAIHKLKATGKRYDARDRDKSGLLIRVGADGTLRWGFRSRIKTGVKGLSPEFRDSFGAVVIGAGGKPDKGNIEDAKAWAIKLKSMTDGGIDPREKRKELAEAPTLADVWEQYRASRRSLKKAKASQEGDERNWRIHIAPVMGKTKVASIAAPEISSFYDKKKTEGRNANQILALLSVIMSEAVRTGAITVNPCREVRRERESNIDWERLNTPEERASLINAAYDEGTDAGLIVELALKTGARKQEILKAQWERITPKKEGGALWVIPNTKQKRTHRSNIPPLLYDRLKEWQEREGIIRLQGWVFNSPVNPQMPREDTKGFFNRVKKSIGKPRLRFHDLRHDFGTQLALAGLSTTDIMAAMGHSNIQTTMRYISLAEAETASLASGLREDAIEAARDALGSRVVSLREGN